MDRATTLEILEDELHAVDAALIRMAVLNDRLTRRVDDLIVANNAFEARARAAEQQLRDLQASRAADVKAIAKSVAGQVEVVMRNRGIGDD